jgi:catechol 2,3-dioxygenase
MAAMTAGNKAIKMLGELALRVNDFPTMLAFYRDVVGLEVYRLFDEYGFLKMGEGVEGHPQLFALFDRKVDVGQQSTTVDHFAFIIELADYDAQRSRLESLGVHVSPKEFQNMGWRSLFFADPEGNTVELVCADPSVRP